MPDEAVPATRLVKRSLTVAGHRTSLSLEDAFWHALRAIAAARDTSVAALVAAVDAGRGEANLSSAVRVFILSETMRASATPTGA